MKSNILTLKKNILLGALILSTPLIKAQNQQILRLIVDDGFSMQNETAVYFDAAGSFVNNVQTDALALPADPGQAQITSHLANLDFQIKCMPLLTQNMTVPIKVTTSTSGMFDIYATSVETLPEGPAFILHDNYTGMDIDLRTDVYSCNISDTEIVARFSLNIYSSTLSGLHGNVIQPTCSQTQDGKIIASVNGSGPWNYYWKDSNNNMIRTVFSKNGPDTLAQLNSGVYKVDVNTDGTNDNASLTFNLQGSIAPHASFECDTLIAKFANTTFTNTSTNADSYTWDFGDGMGDNIFNPSTYYSAENVYTVSLQAYSNQCNETSVYTHTLTVSGSLSLAKNKVNDPPVIGTDNAGLFIQFNHSEPKNPQIKMYEISGNVVYQKTLSGITTERIYPETTILNAGIYILDITDGAGKKSTFQYIKGQ